MKKIAVIGGGITGLAVAHGLARLGSAVTVFEKERETGGLADVFVSGNVAIDKYYRHIFSTHAELLDVIRSLNLEARLVFRRARMAYFSQGRIYPLDTARDLLRFAPLPLSARLRVGRCRSAPACASGSALRRFCCGNAGRLLTAFPRPTGWSKNAVGGGMRYSGSRC